MRILLVEDDELVGSGIRDALTRIRYSVEWVRDGRHALNALQTGSFELVILDLTLPGLDGLEVLRRVRARGTTTPLLILSARDTALHRVSGLDAGADDYMVKPFDLDELIARVRALRRRARNAPDNVLRHGSLTLDPATLSVTYKGQPVSLQRREFMLLHKLLESAGQILNRAQLEESIYGWEGDVGSNTIEVHIHNLRRKLYPEIIRTIRGMGYTVDPPQPDSASAAHPHLAP